MTTSARHNPFATDRMERVLAFHPEWSGTRWEEIDQRWYALDRRAALIGRHGSGKTTFLDAWKTRLIDAGCEVAPLFLNRETSRLSEGDWRVLEDCTGKVIILDGEEQLSWSQRRRFYQLTQKATGLLVTRHRSGRLPTLKHFDPTLEVLHTCVRQLAPDFYDQLAPEFPKWWKDYHGNIREILLRCYDEV